MDKYRLVVEVELEDLAEYEDTMAGLARLGFDIIEEEQV